jgi:hypothetical protein
LAAEFTKVFNMRGWDRAPNPKWQMVPVNGDRYVALQDGAGLTVTSNKPGVVTVTEIREADLPAGFERIARRSGERIFKLHGVSKGDAQIQARGSASVNLAIDTKDKKTVRIAFNYVQDSAGHRTSRVAASAAGWLRTINYIYNGQANIYAILHGTRSVNVPSDLGQVVQWTAGAASEWNTVTGMGASGADFNIFFVWEYEQDSTPFTDHTDAGTLNGNCIFEDNAGTDVGITLAHEMGHFLGDDDHYDAARKHHLMHGITDERGINLSKENVNLMNP